MRCDLCKFCNGHRLQIFPHKVPIQVESHGNAIAVNPLVLSSPIFSLRYDIFIVPLQLG